jgi:hypothetical protein
VGVTFVDRCFDLISTQPQICFYYCARSGIRAASLEWGWRRFGKFWSGEQSRIRVVVSRGSQARFVAPALAALPRVDSSLPLGDCGHANKSDSQLGDLPASVAA